MKCFSLKREREKKEAWANYIDQSSHNSLYEEGGKKDKEDGEKDQEEEEAETEEKTEISEEKKERKKERRKRRNI